MICQKCQEERELKDFYRESICYKCQFAEKEAAVKAANKGKKLYQCCVCRKKMIHKKFCSAQCRNRSLMKKAGHWSKNIVVPDVGNFRYSSK